MTETGLVESHSTVFNYLITVGCCKRCALRFVGDNNANYDNPKHDVERLFSNTVQKDHEERQILKIDQSNPCVICLNLLQDVTLDEMIARPEMDEIIQYDSDTFVNFISFPRSILIREHSMEIHVKEKFQNFFKDRHIVALNRAWSLSIQNRLADRLDKKFDRNSYLQIQFNTLYESEEKESSVMHHLVEKLKKSSKKSDPLSTKNVTDSLKLITAETFKGHASIPPQSATKSVILRDVSYKHEYIFIAGRYCKYARNLFQTPWSGDDVVVKDSVQEIIFNALDDIFNCSSLVFSSSGREDFDVRTLGRGRPFFVKICDPKITKVSYESFRSVEEVIKKSLVVKVRDLQFVDRKCVINIKEGEQFKKKTYRALCIVAEPDNLKAYVDKINAISSVTLQQKTPLRVYHRRSADVRERKIYSLKARTIAGKSNLFELDMVTQAGTYIKEFIHGDLGRTTPSLCELLNGDVDIVALDVLNIHLDFPPSLTHKVKTDEKGPPELKEADVI